MSSIQTASIPQSDVSPQHTHTHAQIFCESHPVLRAAFCYVNSTSSVCLHWFNALLQWKCGRCVLSCLCTTLRQSSQKPRCWGAQGGTDQHAAQPVSMLLSVTPPKHNAADAVPHNVGHALYSFYQRVGRQGVALGGHHSHITHRSTYIMPWI